MMKKFCLIYANCQGRGIETFLNKAPGFGDVFHLHRLDVTDYVNKGMAVPEQMFPKADLLIHQPIRSTHGKSSTDYLKTLLPAHCELISFPYIYNDALWPMFPQDSTVVGQEATLDLFSRGHSLRQVVNMMFHQEIDFRFSERFEKSLAILREKEAETDVRVSEFVVKHLRTRKLFLTQAHPTSTVFIHCVNQILAILGLPKLRESSDTMPNESGLPDCWPTSPYEVAFYGYQYRNNWRHFHEEKMDSNWKRFYVKLIGSIHDAAGLSRNWNQAYVKLLSKTTLLGGEGYVS